MTEQSPIEVRAASSADTDVVRDTMVQTWNTPLVAVHGELIDVTTLPALIAWRSGKPVGLATHRAHPGDSSWEVVSRGMDLVALHRDAVTEGRKLTPSIPQEVDGILMRHELELEWLL